MSRALITALAVFACVSPVVAQDDGLPGGGEPEVQLPVSVRVRLGYGEKIPGSGFTPVFVDLTAHESDQVVSLQFYSGGEAPSKLLELGPISLAKGQPRRVRGLAPSRTWLGSGPISVRVIDEVGAVVGLADVFSDSSSRRLLLLIDRHGAAPTDFGKLESVRRAPVGGQRRKTQWEAAVVADRAELPLSPLGYTGLSAVLLGDLELERWSEDQAEALAGWVAQGGDLILTLGRRGSLLRQSLLGRRLGDALAPIPFERQALTGKEVSLRGLLGTFGRVDEFESVSPPYSSPLVPGPRDRVHLRDDAGRPFVVERRHGLGHIILVAGDLWSPPFLHASHTKGLVETLLARTAPRYVPPARTHYLFHELASVRQPAQVGPAFAVLIIFALVAGPGIYFLLRAKNRGILLWLVIPGLTIGFTALVPFYRLVLKDAESTLVGVRLAESASGRELRVETIDALIFSGGLEQKHLSMAGESATAYSVLPPSRMRRRGAPRVGPVLGGPGPGDLEFDLPVALWGTRYVSFSRTSKQTVLTGRVSLRLPARGEVGQPLVSLDYQGAFPILDAVVLYPSKLGALVHEVQTRLRQGKPYSERVVGVTPSGTYESPDKSLGGLMITRLIAEPFKDLVEVQRSAYLIGRTNEPLPIRAQPNVRTRASTTIVVVRLPVEYTDGIPMGMARRSTDAATVADVNTNTVTRELRTRISFPRTKSRTTTELQARLIAPRGSILRDANLQLYGVAYDGGKASRERIMLAPEQVTRDASGRIVTIALPTPERWVSPEGLLELIQVFDRPRMESDDLYSASVDASVRWGAKPTNGNVGE